MLNSRSAGYYIEHERGFYSLCTESGNKSAGEKASVRKINKVKERFIYEKH